MTRLAVILRDQVFACEENGLIGDTMQTCIDLGYSSQAIETAVDFLGVDGIDTTVLNSLLQLVGRPDGSSALPPVRA